MSIYKKATTSAIPRANRAAPKAAIGPGPTKASLLRVSQIKEGKTVDKQGDVVIQQLLEIKKAGRPVGGEMRSKARLDWLRRRPKKVKFASDAKVRAYEPSAGGRVPSEGEKPELWEGEPEWKDLRELQWKNAEERASVSIKAKAWLREMEDPDEGGETVRMMENKFKAIRFDEELDNLKAKKTWEVVESAAMLYLDELAAEERAVLDDTKWSIYIFGDNPMLEDEEMPFKVEDDRDFDDTMEDLIEMHAKDEERRVIGEMADALTVIMGSFMEQDPAEDDSEEDYLPALYLYGSNPSLLDEPMPFALPEPHPDTTFELGDLSVLPDDNMSMLVDEDAPFPRDMHPDLRVAEPTPNDFRDTMMDLLDLANQGITCSETDLDLVTRLQHGRTAFIPTREEEFFAVPTPSPFTFERRLAIFEKDKMLTDEVFPGDICSTSEARGADVTLLPIDTDPIIQRRLRQPNILDEMMSGPGYVWPELQE
ncbi:hypothetical protein NCC49_001598 [Naganishia albida]|nr:hypothetical protein NCC49_001598 [Naganishia albida]